MEEEKNIMQGIITTSYELENASRNFNNAEDEMIDYYSYQIMANKARLDYLIKRAKFKGNSQNMIEQLKLKNNIQW